MKEKIGYIKTLDGLRAISIVLVVLSHLKDSIADRGTPLHAFYAWGLNGVDLFFAISGFLITTNLIFEMQNSGTLDLKKFYLKRFFRLMPVFWVYLLTIWLLSLTGLIVVGEIELLSSLTFWRNYQWIFFPEAPSQYTGQIWSLSVEEHFYMFLPFFLLLLKKPKKILIGLFFMTVAVAVWRKIGSQPVVYEQYPFFGFDMWGTIGRFDALLFGSVLAFVRSCFAEQFRYLRYVHPVVPIVLLSIVYFFTVPFKYSVEAILYPLLIGSLIFHERSIFSRFLELRMLKHIGQISYSMYLWHQIFCFELPNAPAIVLPFFGGWFALVPIYLISVLSFKYVETPIRRMGYNWIKKKRRPIAALQTI